MSRESVEFNTSQEHDENGTIRTAVLPSSWLMPILATGASPRLGKVYIVYVLPGICHRNHASRLNEHAPKQEVEQVKQAIAQFQDCGQSFDTDFDFVAWINAVAYTLSHRLELVCQPADDCESKVKRTHMAFVEYGGLRSIVQDRPHQPAKVKGWDELTGHYSQVTARQLGSTRGLHVYYQCHFPCCEDSDLAIDLRTFPKTAVRIHLPGLESLFVSSDSSVPFLSRSKQALVPTLQQVFTDLGAYHVKELPLPLISLIVDYALREIVLSDIQVKVFGEVTW